ncbi:hypothetical protein CRYUN_Cryun29cG0005800 [Craigia yunnanensis]
MASLNNFLLHAFVWLALATTSFSLSPKFYDQGCDGSLLLDSTSTFETEKNARGNLNSVRGFEVVDQIKAEVDRGLNQRDLVALSGGHTIGFSQCGIFRNRIYNATNIDPAFAKERRATCLRTGGNTILAPFDPTPSRFDTAYFKNLVKQRGPLTSDQALFNGGSTDNLVKTYSLNPDAFWDDFAKSIIKMGNIKPLTGKKGQIRVDCRKAN